MTNFLDIVEPDDIKGNRLLLARFNWYNAKNRRPAMFYIKNDDLMADPAEPWERSNWFKGENGYFFNAEGASINMAIIGYRARPFSKAVDADGKFSRNFEAEYIPNSGMQFYTEVICLVEGIDEPLLWAADGMTGGAISGIIKGVHKGLLASTRRLSRRSAPLWTYWSAITAQTDNAGQIVVMQSKAGGEYTPPMLIVPEVESMEELQHYYIGDDNYRLCRELYHLHQEAGWFVKF